MTGFWALARKEMLEQRRSWRFLALVGVFTLLALLVSIIPFIVTEVRDEPQGVQMARDELRIFGFTTVGLGTLLAIIVAMGSLASERASGTAAMTLSKPVTRAAFVAAKYLGFVLSIFGALAIASAVMFVLTLIMFDDGGLAGFVRFMAIIAVYLVFIGSIAFFWSGMFSRQLLAGGIALVLFIAFIPLSEIPHTQRYWPVNTVEWAEVKFRELEEAQGPIDELIVHPGPLIVMGRDRVGDDSVTVEVSPVRVGAVPVDHGPTDRSALTLQRFEQLRLELADIKDIDGLAPRIIGGVSAENPESRRRGHLRVIGLDPRYSEGFGALTFTSGGEARLEDLAEDEVYITIDAAEDMDAEAGDQLLLSMPGQELTINVRGVVTPGGLADFFGPTIIMPLQLAQAVMRLDDGIGDIVVSNRGGDASGSELSEVVTQRLRVGLADREVVSQLRELLGQEAVLKALKRMEKNLFGRNGEDLFRLREELQRNEPSDKLISLLAGPDMGSFVMGALDRDGLDDVAVKAGPLFASQAEFQVLDLKRAPFNEASRYWSAFAVALGLIGLLSVGAWAVFRRKEL